MRDEIELHANIMEKGSPLWVIATHGIGEHLERHDYLSELVGQDLNLFRYDLRGHGRSMGKRAYVSNFFDFMEDLSEILEFLRKSYKMKRYVLFGHSMGALITAGYVQNIAKKSFYPERIILNAPPIGVGGPLGKAVSFIPKSLFYYAKNLPFSIPIGELIDLKHLSHDPQVGDQYLADQLNSTKLHTKLLLELVHASKEVFSRPLRPLCPLFCSIGDEDKVVSVEDFLHYFSIVEKAAKVKVFKGAYHEIHLELSRFKRPYFE